MSSHKNDRGVRVVGGLSRLLLGRVPPLTRTVGLVSALATSSVARAQPPATPATAAPAVTDGAPAAEAIQLPTVSVEGKADTYQTVSSQIDRIATPILDTPQTIAVVPEQVMDEQRATTVRDALRNVSGITMSAGEGGRQGDTFILRGFSGQNDVFRDGSRDLGWFTRDTFNLEGVEVFFGPSSVVFGRGSTGGAINLVTKTPKRGTFAEANLIAGTAPTGRAEADINLAISPRVQLRLNAAGQLAKVAERDRVEENRGAVAPSVRVYLADRSTLTVDYLYQRERSVPDYGQPFFNGQPVSTSLGVPRNTFYGVAGSDAEHVDAHVATARLDHQLAEGVKLSNITRFGVVDRFARPTAPSTVTGDVPAMMTVSRQRFETETDNVNVVNQTDLRLDFQTGFVKHTASVGLELSRERRKQTRYNLSILGPEGAATSITGNLLDPDPRPDLSLLERLFNNSTRGILLTAAAYAADQIQLGRYLEVLGSLRLDALRASYTAVNAMNVYSALERRDTLVNWRGGLVVHPIPLTSVYATLGSSSNPSAEGGTLSDATASLEPERNLAAELGAKADLLESRLSLGGSLFQIDKQNARVPGADPLGPPTVLAGKQRVQGLSFGAAGTIIERWKLFGNYTFLRSRIRSHTSPYLVGQALPSTPAHSLSLWTTVNPFGRFTVGGGAVYQAATAVNNPTSAMQLLNEVPSFWRLDAFASYGWKKMDLQLNLANLTNALYYDQTSGSRAVPARGLTAMLSTRLRY
jgi:catecholate siderophore receptor